MFASGANYTKLKTNLRLSINRLKLLEKKKSELALKNRKEIADYLSANKVERAKIRVEHIIREDYLVEAMEILEMYCDLLLARFGLIQQMKTLDDGLAEAISSLIWVAPRLQSDVQELKVVSDQLTAKYGKPYALSCRENGVNTVSEKLMHKLSVQAPPKITVESYLIEIAKYYNVEYEPDKSVMNRDEVFGAEALIDLAPAIPPPPGDGDKKSPPGGGGGGGGFQYPPTQAQPQPGQPLPPSMAPFGYLGPPGAAVYNPPPGASPYLPHDDEEVPPPYFPPDVKFDAGADKNSGAVKYDSQVSTDSCSKPDFASEQLPDVPDLPEIPSDNPTHSSNAGGENSNKPDEEDIDFDDLTRRFEELKKKK